MANPFQRRDPSEQAEQDRWLGTREAYRGHPTAPGPRDPYRPRMGDATYADGQPGVPRLRPTPESQGPGIPGHSPAGPMQPDVFYEGEEDAD